MKKETIIAILTFLILIVIAALVYFLTTPNGDYKEGTYFASAGAHTATIYVNEEGMLKSVFIDSAYIEYDGSECKYTVESYGTVKCVSTTKQILQDGYGMKAASPIEKEWFEQANDFADKVVEEQGLEWLELNEDGSTDSISTVTIHVNEMAEAVEAALEKASK